MKKFVLLLSLLFAPFVTQAQSVPQVSVNLTPTTGSLQTEFTLDASLSRGADGTNQDLEYQFRADSKLPRTAFTSNPVFKFRPIETGDAVAEVVVRDKSTGLTTISGHRYTVRESEQRSVQIKVSTLTPALGESVIYEATVFGNNLNRDKLQARWDFNSDGRWETNFTTSLIASFTPASGKSFPTVEVKFEDGSIIQASGLDLRTGNQGHAQNSTTNFVSIPQNPLRPPVIEVSPRSATIKENTNLSLDGSKTQLTNDSFLEWIIDGQVLPGKLKINYVFKSSGEKTITLRHCLVSNPDYCLETSTVVEVQAKPNDQFLEVYWQNLSDRGRQTTARDYAVATVSDTLRFTVQTQGTPMQGQSFTYRWDFEGDGQWDTNFESDTFVEHTFNQSRDFIVMVEALPSITTNNFTVLRYVLPVYIERNRAPRGDFDFTQTNNFVGERVTYTAKVSDPESAQLVEVRFDSDADGVWDSDFRNQRSWWWIYDQPGDYKVRLQVRDPQGRIEEVSKIMTILPMPQPQTQVLVSHRTQTENQPILLDGSQSAGRKLTYQWTVQGQPQIKLMGAKTNLKLPAGTYQVQLKIRDRLGVQDSVVFPVTFIPLSDIKPQTSQNVASEAPNMLGYLPGSPDVNNYILPPGGVPQGPSPFQIEAGTALPNDGLVSGMRALP